MGTFAQPAAGLSRRHNGLIFHRRSQFAAYSAGSQIAQTSPCDGSGRKAKTALPAVGSIMSLPDVETLPQCGSEPIGQAGAGGLAQIGVAKVGDVSRDLRP